MALNSAQSHYVCVSVKKYAYTGPGYLESAKTSVELTTISLHMDQPFEGSADQQLTALVMILIPRVTIKKHFTLLPVIIKKGTERV